MRILTLAALALSSTLFGSAPPSFPDVSPIDYHLRVVRVSGSGSSPGAAIGCGKYCGTPIVMPTDEPWGSDAQLAGLAHALGGARTDAVTGFIVKPSLDGTARFEGTIYPGATNATLSFEARAPQAPDDPHELVLRLDDPANTATPLAEARLLVRSSRTVALAVPSTIAGEWIVVGITPLDSRELLARLEQVEELGASGGEPVTPPQLVESVQPSYPENARVSGRQGKVILQAVIDVDGTPRALRVLTIDPGCEDLAAASVEAVKRWKYKPGMRASTPVPINFTMTVRFRLE